MAILPAPGAIFVIRDFTSEFHADTFTRIRYGAAVEVDTEHVWYTETNRIGTASIHGIPLAGFIADKVTV